MLIYPKKLCILELWLLNHTNVSNDMLQVNLTACSPTRLYGQFVKKQSAINHLKIF